MRLIDADALIESIKAQAGMLNWMLPAADEITDILSKGFIEQVNRMPTVPQWIPCSERSPEKEGRYLCFWDFGDGYIDYKVLFYMTEKGELFDKGWNDIGDMLNRLVDWSDSMKAWMPLPEPYKGDE